MTLTLEAANKLVADNLGLAYAFSRKHSLLAARYGIDQDELQSEMLLCLTRCSRTYEPSKARFSTWAYGAMALCVRALIKGQSTGKGRFNRHVFSFTQDKHGAEAFPDAAVDAETDRIDAAEYIASRWPNLSERERDVLVGRFNDGKTLQEIGTNLGVDKERVRQIEAGALAKCRGPRLQRIRKQQLA